MSGSWYDEGGDERARKRACIIGRERGIKGIHSLAEAEAFDADASVRRD